MSVDAPRDTCAAKSCKRQVLKDFRFCKAHMVTAWDRLRIPQSEIWKNWEEHLDYLEELEKTCEHDHWIVDCEHFTFPGCLQVPYDNNVAPQALTPAMDEVQHQALRNVYCRRERASGDSCRELRTVMLDKGLQEDTCFIGFGTRADTCHRSCERSSLASMLLSLPEVKKRRHILPSGSRSASSVAKNMLEARPRNGGYTLSGIYGDMFGLPTVKKHTALGDTLMLCEIAH